MSALETIILTAVVTAVASVLVMESYQTTPWLADKLMQWSVRVRYADNPHRAKVREEELSGLLQDLPTLFKFPTAGWFFLRALAYRFGRGLGRTPTDRLLKLRVRRLRARRHWAVLSGALLQTVGIVIGTFLLSRLVSSVTEGLWLVQSLLWYIAVSALMRFAWHVLQWWVETLVVTDKELMIISGPIVNKTYTMPLAEVTDLSFMRPVAGKLLGYGTLRFTRRVQPEAVGQVETIKYLPRPEEIELIFDEKSRSQE